MNIGFDVISDLNLDAEDSFDWEDKATSLYLIIAGNISNDLRVIHQTLVHLSKFYQGIFYMPGSLEHDSMHLIKNRYRELVELCRPLKKVACLYRYVVIVNGVAVLGANGWYGNKNDLTDSLEKLHLHSQQVEDVTYLGASLERLQLHLDVKKIIVVTHSSPSPELFFKEDPPDLDSQIPMMQVLGHDSENKVVTWVYGSYNKNVETTINDINYINNSCYDKNPYWPKRIDVVV
jgi:hypothetical protein